MLTSTANRTALALLFSLVAAAGMAQATKYKAPASEVVQLPKFCWAQYMVGVEGPQYEIPRSSCGVYMNHYCPALLEVIRANKSFDNLGARRQHLLVARRETIYTLNGMKEFPACPIRTHAETTLRQVETSLRNMAR
jgi:hypothetical protein